MKKAIFLLAVALVFIGQSWAMEDRPQLGMSFNSSREVTEAVSLNFHLIFPNFAASTAAYPYLGLGYKASDNLSVEAIVAYGFEPKKECQGAVYGLVPILKLGDVVFSSDLEHFTGLKFLFSYHSLTYPVGFARFGVDERNYYYLASKDKKKSSYQVGPSLKVPFSDKASISLNYFYAFENDGEDANVFKASFAFKF